MIKAHWDTYIVTYWDWTYVIDKDLEDKPPYGLGMLQIHLKYFSPCWKGTWEVTAPSLSNKPTKGQTNWNTYVRHNWLLAYLPLAPLKKKESVSWDEMKFPPVFGKIKKVFQTTNQSLHISYTCINDQKLLSMHIAYTLVHWRIDSGNLLTEAGGDWPWDFFRSRWLNKDRGYRQFESTKRN